MCVFAAQEMFVSCLVWFSLVYFSVDMAQNSNSIMGRAQPFVGVSAVTPKVLTSRE